jgi:hypothetical protein
MNRRSSLTITIAALLCFGVSTSAFTQQGPLGTALALQLPFCFEVRALSDRLVSSTPE